VNDQRKQRAERAEKMRKERERHDRRQRNLITVAFVVVIIALVAGVAVWYSQNKPEPAETYNDPPTELVTPKKVTDDYGVEVTAEDFGGKTADDAPHVVVYEDFQCPVCQIFEQASGDHLMNLAEDGKITLEYRTIAFLDKASETEYSSRSANAAMCVLEDTGVKKFKKMHDLLYQNQPEEGGEGLPDSKLISFAEEAGAADAKSCIKKRTYDPWLRDATEASAKNDVEGTPAVRVNGKDVEGKDGGAVPTPDLLDKAIKAATK